MNEVVDVLIVGAGPSGLSCAIEAKKASLSSVVLDKGTVVDAIRRFPTNVIWFSTPELLELGSVPLIIPGVRPTRVDSLNYYQKVSQHFGLSVRTFEAVEEIGKRSGVFEVRTQRRVYAARNVVIATGYFDNPNKLGIPGETLGKVFHYYIEPYEFFGRDVVVVGGRNSAVEAALDLYRHGARVTLIHRSSKLSEGVKYWILPDIENRIKKGEIKALFDARVEEVREESVVVATREGIRELSNDVVFVLIGFHPDTTQLRKFGIEIDGNTLAPCHDPKTFETNIAGLYVAGSIVAGKNNNKVFVENGRLHGPIIISSILSHTGSH